MNLDVKRYDPSRKGEIAGLYNATKILAFVSYFCKMRVKILY